MFIGRDTAAFPAGPPLCKTRKSYLPRKVGHEMRRGVPVVLAFITGSILTAVALCVTAVAEVKVTVNKGDHVVQGTTASGLVRSLNGNPVRGDHGSAYASIHPNYNLSVKTRERGGMCRADVTIRLNSPADAFGPPGTPSGMVYHVAVVGLGTVQDLFVSSSGWTIHSYQDRG